MKGFVLQKTFCNLIFFRLLYWLIIRVFFTIYDMFFTLVSSNSQQLLKFISISSAYKYNSFQHHIFHLFSSNARSGWNYETLLKPFLKYYNTRWCIEYSSGLHGLKINATILRATWPIAAILKYLGVLIGIRPLIPQISPGALGVRGLIILCSVEEFSVLLLDVVVNDGFS